MKRVGNQFQIQGLNVTDICKEFGTPLYVYDADKMEEQVRKFKTAFSGVKHQVKFACKSLTNLSVMKIMRVLGTGLDTVSLQEIRMGLSVGYKPEQIVFTPNCVDFSEIEEAVELGVMINIENIPNLIKFGKKYGGNKPVFVRMNPFIMAEMNSEKVDWWHKQSKFGISVKQLEEAHDIISEYDMNVCGIHIHSSSVIMNPEIFMKGAEAVFELAKQFKDLKFVDFGGGIKVKYKPEDEVIDVNALGEGLKKLVDKFEKETNKEIELWFEPGRYLVSECGHLLVEANVIKNNGTRDFVGVNSGFNHLIRPMMYDSYHEIINVTNPDGKPNTYTVVGNICEIDNFAVDRALPEVREYDILSIENAGAYGYSMASNYNSRFRPAEVIIYNGQALLSRKRDTYEDLVKNQIVLDIKEEELLKKELI